MSLGSNEQRILEAILNDIGSIKTDIAVIKSTQHSLAMTQKDMQRQTEANDRKTITLETNMQNFMSAIDRTIETAILRHHQSRADIQQEVSLTKIGLITGAISLTVSLIFGAISLIGG